VGFTTLPVMITHQAAPGKDYALRLEVQVEQKERNNNRVRDENGGSPITVDTLPEEQQEAIKVIQNFVYSTAISGKASSNKATLTVPFDILKPGITSLMALELKASYVPLWTAEDFLDDDALIEKTRPTTSALVPRLNRETVFFPLMKQVQASFQNAWYPLRTVEAALITKLITLVLEMGIPKVVHGQKVDYPRWFLKLCRMLARNPQAGAEIDRLVTDLLYPELLYDAIMFGFSMVNTVTRKDKFGAVTDPKAYADELVAALTGKGGTLDFSRAYVPLVLAGLISNTRITMPNEQTRDTTSSFAMTLEKRESEKTAENQHVFALGDDLVTRALEHF
jgi:hypothetical protein